MPLLLLLLIALPFFGFLLFFNIAALSFYRLGLSPEGAVLVFSLSLLGSVINIPVSKEKVVVEKPEIKRFPFLFYYPPEVREQVIAVNVGGAVIPTLLALYVLARAPLVPTLLVTVIVTIVAKILARPVKGVGISMPAYIPPIVAAGASMLLAPENPAAAAYVSGVIGTLVGADLLNLDEIRNLGAQMVSIGGAGVYDGIFLVGVIAAFLA